MRSSKELRQQYPLMFAPMECENGCGAVIEVLDSFESYERDEHGQTKMICECCAAEIGHRNESDDTPEQAPVCHRPKKRQLKERKPHA